MSYQIMFYKQSKKIKIATDHDREGEALAWHVIEVLDQKIHL